MVFHYTRLLVGVLTLCKSLTGLYNELVAAGKLPYLCTYKLSQDCVELFFCKIRGRLGWNNNPSRLQFKAAYKALLVANEITLKTTGNCIPPYSPGIIRLWKKMHVLYRIQLNSLQVGDLMNIIFILTL